MFTGIIQAIGTVQSTHPTENGVRIVIDPGSWGHQPNEGDSIACSGCCLTVVSQTEVEGRVVWSFDAIPQTLEVTTLGRFEKGTRVNLERSLRVGDGLDGHQVQGHVDGQGEVVSVDESDGYRVRIKVPGSLMGWMIPKGSVSIDGISLTIAEMDVDEAWIEVAIIPETLERTTLGDRVVGDRVNLECDAMVKTIVHTMERMGMTTR